MAGAADLRGGGDLCVFDGVKLTSWMFGSVAALGGSR